MFKRKTGAVADIVLTYSPHKYQKEIHEYSHIRHRVLCCTRRFGKSTLALVEAFIYAHNHPKSSVYIVTPTYGEAERIYWRNKEMLETIIPPEIREQSNEAKLFIQLKNKSVINFVGSDNREALRGLKISFLIFDEAAYCEEDAWRIVSPGLTPTAKVLFLSTPRGNNWFKRLYDQGEEGNPAKMGDWKSFRVTGQQIVDLHHPNLDLTQEKLDSYRRTESESWYRSQYEADFVTFEGLIYDEFDPGIHVIEPFALPPSWGRYGGMDAGYNDPTVVIFVAVDPENNTWYIYREYYSSQKTVLEHSQAIKMLSEADQLKAIYFDPSDPQIRAEFNYQGIFTYPARKEGIGKNESWIMAGVDRIKRQMKIDPVTKKPHLFVFNNCTHLLEELRNYQWEVRRAGEQGSLDKPKPGYDHCADSLRYFAISFERQQSPGEVRKVSWFDRIKHSKKKWGIR